MLHRDNPRGTFIFPRSSKNRSFGGIFQPSLPLYCPWWFNRRRTWWCFAIPSWANSKTWEDGDTATEVFEWELKKVRCWWNLWKWTNWHNECNAKCRLRLLQTIVLRQIQLPNFYAMGLVKCNCHNNIHFIFVFVTQFLSLSVLQLYKVYLVYWNNVILVEVFLKLFFPRT